MYHFSKKTQNLHFLHFGQWTSFDLCTAVSLLDSLTITLQVNIISKENTSRVDFAIKKIISKMLEEIILNGLKSEFTLLQYKKYIKDHSGPFIYTDCDINNYLIKYNALFNLNLFP